MIVVSDTSPINYLVLIELQDLLPKLFDRILIPEAVHRELQSDVAPDAIKRFLAEAPDWLEVRLSPEVDATLQQLDSGEREVIALALSTTADSVLLDERKARQAARERGLRVSGTLGVIRRAADQELITLNDALDRLEKTNFRAAPRLLNSLRGGGPETESAVPVRLAGRTVRYLADLLHSFSAMLLPLTVVPVVVGRAGLRFWPRRSCSVPGSPTAPIDSWSNDRTRRRGESCSPRSCICRCFSRA